MRLKLLSTWQRFKSVFPKNMRVLFGVIALLVLSFSIVNFTPLAQRANAEVFNTLNNLAVPSPITALSQFIADQRGNVSALAIGQERVTIFVGADEAVDGGPFPLFLGSSTTPQDFANGNTRGRLLRLYHNDFNAPGNPFYDFGIDVDGNLFITVTRESLPVLSISPQGAITINRGTVRINNLPNPPSDVNTVSVVVDPQSGQLYSQP